MKSSSMHNEINLTRLTADVPKKYHTKLKSIALVTGKTIREILMDAIDSIDMECIKSEHIPNKETLKSIHNIEQGKNLTEIDDLRDLFKKLGI